MKSKLLVAQYHISLNYKVYVVTFNKTFPNEQELTIRCPLGNLIYFYSNIPNAPNKKTAQGIEVLKVLKEITNVKNLKNEINKTLCLFN